MTFCINRTENEEQKLAARLRFILVHCKAHLMKKKALTLALISTLFMSCSMFRHIDGKDAGRPENWHDVHRGDQRFIAILTGFMTAFVVGFFATQTPWIKR